ncbi:MAG: macro domain-containing protein [Bacillota bacterium]
MKTEIDGVILEITEGDITKQPDVEVVVNAANAQLRTGGGVAGAVHRAAGPELAEACREFAPIKTGEAVITGAYELNNDYIIHCLGPVYGVDKPEDQFLVKTYKNALKIAEENNIKSIAFPSISTGAFGYPIEQAAVTALRTVKSSLKNLQSIEKIRFVLFSSSDYKIYKDTMKSILNLEE